VDFKSYDGKTQPGDCRPGTREGVPSARGAEPNLVSTAGERSCSLAARLKGDGATTDSMDSSRLDFLKSGDPKSGLYADGLTQSYSGSTHLEKVC